MQYTSLQLDRYLKKMSSPPKKIRKSGVGNATPMTTQNDSAQIPRDEIQMDEDLDPAAMYEDEEGN